MRSIGAYILLMNNSIFKLEQRADLLCEAIATVRLQIEQIEATGEMAPPGCFVVRYQARGSGRTYWYYKLQATEPIFTTKNGEKTKYQHLGKGGSPAHIEALMQVSRRNQIEALQRTLTALDGCLSDLYDNKSNAARQ